MRCGSGFCQFSPDNGVAESFRTSLVSPLKGLGHEVFWSASFCNSYVAWLLVAENIPPEKYPGPQSVVAKVSDPLLRVSAAKDILSADEVRLLTAHDPAGNS